MILWGETLGKPQIKISPCTLLSHVCSGRGTHPTGSINRAPCWAAAGIALQQVCRIWATCLWQIPVLLPASHPILLAAGGTAPLLPLAPAAVPRLQGAPLPPTQGLLFMAKAEAGCLGMDGIHVPDALGWGLGVPLTVQPNRAQSLPWVLPCWVPGWFFWVVSFIEGWIASQTNAPLQWCTTCFLVDYAGLKARTALTCRCEDCAVQPTALQEALCSQNVRMGMDV